MKINKGLYKSKSTNKLFWVLGIGIVADGSNIKAVIYTPVDRDSKFYKETLIKEYSDFIDKFEEYEYK